MKLTRIAVIDISASMKEAFSGRLQPGTFARATARQCKFDAALDHLRFALQKMPRGSQVFIIAFAESAEVIYRGPIERRDEIEQALSRLQPTGRSTNLGSAFELALSLLDAREYSVKLLDVLTDGLSNEGDPVTPAVALRKKHGVYLHLYLIDTTDEGTAIAQEVIGLEGEGEIDPVANAEALLDRQSEREAADRRTICKMDMALARGYEEKQLFLERVAGQERPRVTAAYPEALIPGEWRTVEIFIYLNAFREVVQREVEKLHFREEVDYGAASSQFPRSLPEGCPITVSLSSETIRTNPSELTIRWLEPFNRLPFRISPSKDSEEGTAATLDVDILADGVLVASMALPIAVTSGRAGVSAQVSDAQWYEDIFASYARQDLDLVRHFKERYAALGLYMFIDLDDLRSGAMWRPALFERIDRSDLFQLFWSEPASKSEYVTMEWQHALKISAVKGRRFIRPVYWDIPMPGVPEQLTEINFRRLEFAVRS
jgi:hypothetical protein